MTFAFFWIPARQSQDAERQLNESLFGRRVLSVEKHFCAAPDAGWAVCVEFLDQNGIVGADQRKGRPIDYREVLDEATFRIYSELRVVRKELADAEGVPPYVVVTNEQIAAMAQLRCSTLMDLERISGFGPARAQKYGQRLLECLRRSILQPEEGVAG